MATLFVDKIDPQSGTTLSLGSSGDTLQATTGAINNIGIGMADSWKIANSQVISADTDTVVNAGWTRNSTEYSQIGTGLTESSGVFTFPQTGIYLINAMAQVADATDMRYIALDMEYSTDSGSNFSDLTKTYTFIKTTSSTTFSNINASISIDVTNISTSRLRFVIGGDEQFTLSGNASSFRTGFQIIRLGA
jgi:hypothetical protein